MYPKAPKAIMLPCSTVNIKVVYGTLLLTHTHASALSAAAVLLSACILCLTSSHFSHSTIFFLCKISCSTATTLTFKCDSPNAALPL